MRPWRKMLVCNYSRKEDLSRFRFLKLKFPYVWDPDKSDKTFWQNLIKKAFAEKRTAGCLVSNMSGFPAFGLLYIYCIEEISS